MEKYGQCLGCAHRSIKRGGPNRFGSAQAFFFLAVVPPPQGERKTPAGTGFELGSVPFYSGGPLSGNLFCIHFLALVLGTCFAPFNSACMEAMLKAHENAIYTGIEMK